MSVGADAMARASREIPLAAARALSKFRLWLCTKMAKWNVIAYLLWLVSGWFGGHHFYLGRDKQGILWITSFGGFFGVGWLRDFAKIPAYVQEANRDPSFMEPLAAYMRHYKTPRIFSNLHRLVGQVAFGYFYRWLIYCAIPEDYSSTLLIVLLVPLGSAFGTFMVSNVGMFKSSYKYSLAGAYTGEFLFGEAQLVSYLPSFAVAVSMFFSTYGWDFRREPPARERTCCKRFLAWLLFFVLFWLLILSGVYYNATIETDDGETVKVREAVNHFFNSPAWRELKKSFWKIYADMWREGWEGARRSFIDLADVTGEDSALETLKLKKGVGMSEVKEQYKRLAKEWHPDHHQGASEETKLYVKEKFMKIQKAYELLSELYGGRSRGRKNVPR